MKKISKLQKLKIEAVKVATKQKLAETPNCEFCGIKAITCHHFIRQSRSNYLRTKKENLISICAKCHFRLHNGYEQIMTGILIKQRGQKWFDKLEKESHIMISDNQKCWKEIIKELEN